jgi:acylphosphatase
MERREIYFSGRVQGVGFRYTARAIAGRMPVVGYVQNLSDGRVLLVAEGTAEVLTRLVAAIQDEMDRYIDNTEINTKAATGEFTAFDIRH